MLVKGFTSLALSVLISTFSFAQKNPNPVAATAAADRLAGFEQRQKLQDQSLVRNIEFQSLGPTVMSGRVVDLEVNPNDPTEFYVAYASGGLWHTKTNGQSFEPIFDDQAVMTIGDIAINWRTNEIWVGTGENNSSRSSYSGVGMYHSADGGQTWQHRGLPESHHIGRIALHPTDNKTLYVAVIGHLYSPNKERGVYKTTDGGTSWQQVFSIDAQTGAIDLLLAPDDPNTIYASFWQRKRHAWDFGGSGPNSGIWISRDGGANWEQSTTEANGFAAGPEIGRIGLAVSKADANVLYALHDNQNRRPKEDENEEEGLQKDDFREMSKEAFLKLDEKELASFLEDNGFPEKYSVASLTEMVASEKILPIALVEYLEDANSKLFDTPVIGAELFRSDDKGKTWKKTHEGYLDDVVYSYGYYFGMVRASDADANKVYIAGVPVLKSDDGGAIFESINGDNVHVDHHALYINPNRTGHLINGNDGGINISYDDGENWVKCNSPAVGQFYTVQVDNAKPYNVYGGLQDNGVWKGPSTYEASSGWHQTGHYPYKMLLGGDGFQVAIDPRDNNTVYTGYQFGWYYRIDATTGQQSLVRPKHDLGERPLRFNWQTPIHLSVHSPEIIYMGSNKFHRSMDMGATWNQTSDDLTKGGRKGNVSYGTLTSIHESPLRFGLIYVGTDDGYIHVSKDAGQTWTNITGKLPKDMWVTRVQASAHDEATVYATLNGYRWDYFDALVYKSTDYGKTWERIGTDLPQEPVNVIKEDPTNPKLLYVGTDHGLYCSINGGQRFMAFGPKLPAVAVHDLVVQARERELVVGTHGRSLYKANIEHLQLLHDSILQQPLHVFALKEIAHNAHWGSTWSKWLETKDPNCSIPLFLMDAGPINIKIKTKGGLALLDGFVNGAPGINYFDYNLQIPVDAVEAYKSELKAQAQEEEKTSEAPKLKEADNGKHYLLPGTYLVSVEAGGTIVERELVIKAKQQ